MESLCEHPGTFENMCVLCGKNLEETGVPLRYIHKGLRLNQKEINQICESEMRIMESQRKLYLVLDLDHTLLNSTGLNDMTRDEEYLKSQPGDNGHLLFKLQSMGMMTKLRPYVRSFLKEASKLFVMYIYTKGDRRYAREMAKLLDPKREYFPDRVISRDDSTVRHKKRLDVVLGNREAVLIVDDTKHAWSQKVQGNVIDIERYHYFASSCREFKRNHKSLSEFKMDESQSNGALRRVLSILKRTHRLYFEDNSKDVRAVLKQANSI